MPTPSRPPELAWIAGLRLHWVGVTPARRRRALALLHAAAQRADVERCLDGIQDALGALYVNRLHAGYIILELYRALAGAAPAEAVRVLAGEIRQVLESFESTRPQPRRRKK